MAAPRFHPLTRLFFCALGILGVLVLRRWLLFSGSALASAWTGQRHDELLLDFSTRFALPLIALSYPGSLAWIYWCRTRFDRRSMLSLGFRAPRALPDWTRGALVGALSIGLLSAILWLTGMISVAGWSVEALEMGAGRALLSLLGYAILFFAVGFFEETLFRGYALHNLFYWLGWRGAVAAQAATFALVHLGNVGDGSSSARLAALGALPSLALIAVFFALCYRKTGSLWFPIGFHFSWNFCLGCVFSLPVSGITTFHLFEVSENQDNWLSGGGFGAEGSFFLIPILVALIYYISRAPDHPQALLDLELMNRTETVAAPAALPETEPPEDDEPARENRYGTKFGTSQGFSADTLRELRELQEAREREQNEAREAAKREARAQLEIAAPTLPTLQPLDIAPLPVIAASKLANEPAPATTETVEAQTTSQPQAETLTVPPAPVETRKAVAAQSEAATPAKKPAPIEQAAPTPAPETVKKKPPAPRW